eukprot:403345002
MEILNANLINQQASSFTRRPTEQQIQNQVFDTLLKDLNNVLDDNFGGQFRTYLLLAFGLNNYTAILLSEDQQGLKYDTIVSKNYQTIQPTDQTGIMTVSKLFSTQFIQYPNSNAVEQGLTFLLGTASQSRVVKFKFSLQFDPTQISESQNGFSIQAQEQEYYIYEKGFTARVSNFFNKLVSNQASQEALQSVKDILVMDYLVFIITSSEVIIVNKESGRKISSDDYIQSIQQFNEQDSLTHSQIVSRQLKSLSYLSADITITSENKVFLNMFIEKRQLVQYQNSYQNIPQSHIILISQCFLLGEQVFRERDDQILQYDVTRHTQGNQIQKAQSCSFPYKQETLSLLFMDLESQKCLVLEVMPGINLSNQNIIPENRLLGISIEASDILNSIQDIKLIFSRNILEFMIESRFYSDFTALSIISLKDQAQSKVQAQATSVQQQAPLTGVRKEELKRTIYQYLDIIASIVNQGNNQGDKQSKLNQINTAISESLQQLSFEDYTQVLIQILHESMDQKINDSHFNIGQQPFEDMLIQQRTNGLIMASLRIKATKLRVIKQFIEEIDLLQNPTQKEMKQFSQLQMVLNKITINMQTALEFKQYWDNLIDQGRQRAITYKNEPVISLEIKIMYAALQFTAEKMGFSQEIVKQYGTTSENIVFSDISSFDQTILNLCELILNKTLYYKIFRFDERSERQEQANGEEVLIKGCLVLNNIVEKTVKEVSMELSQSQELRSISDNTYLQDMSFYGNIFELCKQLSLTILNQGKQCHDDLIQMTHLLLGLMTLQNLHNHPEINKQFELYRDELIDIIDKCSKKEITAINIAVKYEGRYKLCELIYKRGSQFYHILQEQIRKWPDYLSQSIEIIYDLDSNAVYESTLIDNIGNQQFKTFDKVKYEGMKLFEIFEEQHPESLEEFLEQRNRRLFALLKMRQKVTMGTQDLLERIIQKTQFVDTMRVLSSIAPTSIQILTNGDLQMAQSQDQYQVNIARFDVSQTQFEIHQAEQQQREMEDSRISGQFRIPDSQESMRNAKLQIIDEFILEKRLRELQNEHGPLDRNQLLTVFMLLQNGLLSQGDQINLQNCLNYLWTKVVQSDEERIALIQSKLPIEGQKNQIYSESSIEMDITDTNLYRIAKKIQDNPLLYDQLLQFSPQYRSHIFLNFPEHKKGLTAIIALLEMSNNSQLFANQYLGNSQLNLLNDDLFGQSISQLGSQYEQMKNDS